MHTSNRHLSSSPLAAVGLLVVVSGCATETTTERLGLDDPPTVEGLELDRYDGSWFEIGNYPTTFQEGCSDTIATYSQLDDGNIDVLNECVVDGEETIANGVARPVDVARGKLEVSFFGPFWGDYWVFEVGEGNGSDADYTYAVVVAPSRDFLWILAREPSLPDSTVDGIFERVEAESFDRDRFVFTDQSAAE